MIKRQSPAVQIALIVGAVLFGVLLDRLVFGAGVPSFFGSRAATTSATNSAATNGANTTVRSSGSPASSEIHVDRAASSAAASRTGSLDAILALRDPGQRLRDLQGFINTISPADFADALKRLRQLTNSNERELASRLLVARWVQTDPDGALQFAAGNRGYEYLAEDVFGQYAAADFDAAMTRAQAIPGVELRYRALRGILSFKADTDPSGALKLAQSLGDFRGSEPLTSAIYRQWAAQDPKAAALQATADSQGQGPGEGWRSPVGAVVDTWAEQDPVAAANWSLSLGDAETQARSLGQVMRQWTREDPQAAANWIYALDSGASRDAAIAGLAQSLAGRDPQTALSWIGTITDETTRGRTLQRVSGVIMWRDPQNGPALLQAAGLPADQIRGGRGGRRGP